MLAKKKSFIRLWHQLERATARGDCGFNDRWLIDVSRRYQTGFYVTAGGLLIALGAAELWLSFL